jgi:hypothetical protein
VLAEFEYSPLAPIHMIPSNGRSVAASSAGSGAAIGAAAAGGHGAALGAAVGAGRPYHYATTATMPLISSPTVATA